MDKIASLQTNLRSLGQKIAEKILLKSLPPLTLIELFLTEACNLRCDYCFVATKKAYKRMSKEVAQRAVDLLMWESRGEKEVGENSGKAMLLPSRERQRMANSERRIVFWMAVLMQCH